MPTQKLAGSHTGAMRHGPFCLSHINYSVSKSSTLQLLTRVEIALPLLIVAIGQFGMSDSMTFFGIDWIVNGPLEAISIR
jgi:hypothetical protein